MSNIDDFMRELGSGDRTEGKSEKRVPNDDRDLVETIWNESSKLGMHESFDVDSAWLKVNDAVEKRQGARVVALRLVPAAAAVLLLVLFATRFLQSDTGRPVEGPVVFSTALEAQEYAYSSLYQIAEEVMASARSNAFESRVVEMAGERFDGEYNVLLRDLLSDEAAKGKWAKLLGAFYNIDGANYFPQVYLPDYEDYPEKSSPPVAVIHTLDSPTAQGEYIYDAFRVDNKGKLRFYKRVSQKDIDQERIWVFSLNERVGYDGQLLNNYASVSPRPDRINGRIDKMRVMAPKESWAGGSSEVHMRAVLEYWNGINARGEPVDVPCDRTTFSHRGVPVRYFSRDEIASGQMIEVDYHLHDSWDANDFLRDEVAYRLLIFEEDIWPNTPRDVRYTLADGTQRTMSYSSAQEHYTLNALFGTTSPPGWSSTAYPQGVGEHHLINAYEHRNDPDIYFSTETY